MDEIVEGKIRSIDYAFMNEHDPSEIEDYMTATKTKESIKVQANIGKLLYGHSK